jgi:hypothetical protein
MPISLAGVRFRNVLEEQGGPIEKIEAGQFMVRGRPWFQANAYLKRGCTPDRGPGLYSDADGSGANRCPVKAQHMAISEAMERWAYHTTVNSADAAVYGFDVDPSTNGMAAFPGVLARQARRRSYLEAVERFSIISWWDGLAEGRLISTDWPDVDAVLINGPAGGFTAVTFTETKDGYALGHAADESIGAACEKAIVEMERHARVVRYWHAEHDRTEQPASVQDRRSLFFSTEEGFAQFRKRIGVKPSAPPPSFDLVCDKEIPGPWAQYSTVWRVAFRPPSRHFLSADHTYYFC